MPYALSQGFVREIVARPSHYDRGTREGGWDFREGGLPYGYAMTSKTPCETSEVVGKARGSIADQDDIGSCRREGLMNEWRGGGEIRTIHSPIQVGFEIQGTIVGFDSGCEAWTMESPMKPEKEDAFGVVEKGEGRVEFSENSAGERVDDEQGRSKGVHRRDELGAQSGVVIVRYWVGASSELPCQVELLRRDEDGSSEGAGDRRTANDVSEASTEGVDDRRQLPSHPASSWPSM